MLKVAPCESNAVAWILTAEVGLVRGAACDVMPLLGVSAGLVLLRQATSLTIATQLLKLSVQVAQEQHSGSSACIRSVLQERRSHTGYITLHKSNYVA